MLHVARVNSRSYPNLILDLLSQLNVFPSNLLFMLKAPQDTGKKRKRQATNWGKKSAEHTPDKEFSEYTI